MSSGDVAPGEGQCDRAKAQIEQSATFGRHEVIVFLLRRAANDFDLCFVQAEGPIEIIWPRILRRCR